MKDFKVINSKYLKELIENGEVVVNVGNDPTLDKKSLELKDNFIMYNIMVYLGYDEKTLAQTSPVIFVEDGISHNHILEISFKNPNLLAVLKLLGLDEEASTEAHVHFLNELILLGKQHSLKPYSSNKNFSYTSTLYVQAFPKSKNRLILTDNKELSSQNNLTDFYEEVHKVYHKKSKELLKEKTDTTTVSF